MPDIRYRTVILFAVILIAVSINVSAIPGDNIGSHDARGGYITKIDIKSTSNTNHWQGYYGVITAGNSLTYPDYFNISGASIGTIRSLELGAIIQQDDVILITSSGSPPSLSELQNGDLSLIDSITGTGTDSGTNTFTNISNYTIPCNNITNVPTAYMFVNSTPQYQDFKQGLLKDSNGNPVFIVSLNVASKSGFDNTSYYFQFMVPNNYTNPRNYYMYYVSSYTDGVPPIITITNPGAGGGGAGVTSGEDPKNIEKRETRDEFLTKDTPVSYKFVTPEIPVREIIITANLNAGLTSVQVELLKNTSKLVTQAAPGIVFKNVNIWVGTAGFATPKNIKEEIIKFRVENSWMSANNVQAGDISMLRWDTTWSRIETKEISKDANHTYFEAKTNAFSPFAISAKVPEIVPIVTVPAPTPTITPTVTVTPVVPAIPAWVYALIAIVIIAAAVYFLVIRKKEEKK